VGLFQYRKIGLARGDGIVLFKRWSIALPCGWSIKLHHLLRPDYDRCPHDHPWNFWSLILWGGYEEIIRSPIGS
jgi:hypothetical protein